MMHAEFQILCPADPIKVLIMYSCQSTLQDLTLEDVIPDGKTIMTIFWDNTQMVLEKWRRYEMLLRPRPPKPVRRLHSHETKNVYTMDLGMARIRREITATRRWNKLHRNSTYIRNDVETDNKLRNSLMCAMRKWCRFHRTRFSRMLRMVERSIDDLIDMGSLSPNVWPEIMSNHHLVENQLEAIARLLENRDPDLKEEGEGGLDPGFSDCSSESDSS